MAHQRKPQPPTCHSRHTTFIGLVIGIILGFFITARVRSSILSGHLMTFTCGTSSNIESSSFESPPFLEPSDGGKDLIFVGVMTANKFLPTRAVAVYETWGKTLPGKIAFFSSSDSSTTADIPLIKLPGVDDSYPPQKKSFMMLKYMHDNFLDRFEWFMRADDDVYVRGDKLELFLRSINSSKPHFIGQAGMGKKEEQGELSLEATENFCMGGPGMVLSRETLRRVVPHIKYCIKNLYSTHEDVEVGRCIRKFAGISCTWSYEMQTIFYHNSSGSEAFTGNLKQKEVHRAITLHPIKQHEFQYRVHNYMQSLRIQELQQLILTLLRDIRDANQALNETSTSIGQVQVDIERLGKRPNLSKFQPNSTKEVIPWDFFMRTLFSDTNVNPKRRVDDSLKEALTGIINDVMELLNKYSLQRGRVIEFKEVLYGYRRVVPTYGVDYILDLLLMYKRFRGRKLTSAVRRHGYFQQAFTELQIRDLDEEESDEEVLLNLVQNGTIKSSTKDKIISFILPLAGRFETFSRFLSYFEDVCLKNHEKVRLVVVLYKSDDEDYDNNKHIYSSLREKYLNYDLKLVEAKGTFSRAAAMELGAKEMSYDTLLFFMDVDMVFTRDFLERTRLNTIQHEQAYFPIVFSQFNPEMVYENETLPDDNFAVNEESGYWRQFGFGIGAMYKSDLNRIGGFNTVIQGWGREDVDLYDKAVKSNLTVFRAVDLGLVHVYHKIVCDKDLPSQQYLMCVGSLASSYASVNKLAEYVYNNVMSDDGAISL